MIYPKCKNIIKDSSGNAMGVRYDGYVIPCCFFGIEFAFNELKELLGDDIKNIHLKSGKTLDEINKSKDKKINSRSSVFNFNCSKSYKKIVTTRCAARTNPTTKQCRVTLITAAPRWV